MPGAMEPFRDHTVYVQLRVDPFYRRIQERRPEVAHAVAQIIEEMLTRQEALCHGDYTPKNMLVHQTGFTLVDYETAHFGDPTMDLGLFLAHLLLKACRAQRDRPAFIELTRSFWQGLCQPGLLSAAWANCRRAGSDIWGCACWRGSTAPARWITCRNPSVTECVNWGAGSCSIT